MMYSLQNLGVIQSNHKKTEKNNLMKIESVFLVVSLLTIHKAFVSRDKTLYGQDIFIFKDR